MPEPTMNDNEERFMSRCIPKVIEDGTAENQDQAVAICYSMWEKRDKEFNWLGDHPIEVLGKSLIESKEMHEGYDEEENEMEVSIKPIAQMLMESGHDLSDLLSVIVSMSVMEFGTETTLHMIMTAIPAAQLAMGLRD